MTIVDLFAGLGGWDLGARSIGLPDPLGIELNPDACADVRRGDAPGGGTMSREHVIRVVIRSDRDPADLAEDVADTLRDVAEGYIGDPDQHAIYEAEIVLAEPA